LILYRPEISLHFYDLYPCYDRLILILFSPSETLTKFLEHVDLYQKTRASVQLVRASLPITSASLALTPNSLLLTPYLLPLIPHSAFGNLIKKEVLSFTLVVNEIVPPDNSMIFFAIASPNPIPVFFVVKFGTNNFS